MRTFSPLGWVFALVLCSCAGARQNRAATVPAGIVQADGCNATPRRQTPLDTRSAGYSVQHGVGTCESRSTYVVIPPLAQYQYGQWLLDQQTSNESGAERIVRLQQEAALSPTAPVP